VKDSCADRQLRGGWLEGALADGCEFPIEPRNTWSNLAYPLAGWIFYFNHGSATAWALALALTALGVGSALYHGLKTRWANKLDLFGIYWVFGALLVHGMAPYAPATPWVMGVAGFVLAALLVYAIPAVNLDLQVGILLGFSTIAACLNGSWQLALAALGVYLLGFGAWNIDKSHQTWLGLWGHAIWHVLTAIAVPLTFLAQLRP